MKRTLFIALCLALAVSGCVAPKPRKLVPVRKAQAAHVPKKENYWRGEGVKGSPKIVIELGAQRVHFFKGDKLVGDSVVSTGKTGFDTPPGEYHVIQKDKDHVSNLYGTFVNATGEVVRSNVDITKDHPPAGVEFRGAKMPYFMRFHDGYGLHAGYVPSHRASHGCVRLPGEIAMHFFNHSEIGTPVILKE